MGSVKRLEAMLILWKNGVDGRIERLSQMELNQGQRAHSPYFRAAIQKKGTSCNGGSGPTPWNPFAF